MNLFCSICCSQSAFRLKHWQQVLSFIDNKLSVLWSGLISEWNSGCFHQSGIIDGISGVEL